MRGDGLVILLPVNISRQNFKGGNNDNKGKERKPILSNILSIGSSAPSKTKYNKPSHKKNLILDVFVNQADQRNKEHADDGDDFQQAQIIAH